MDMVDYMIGDAMANKFATPALFNFSLSAQWTPPSLYAADECKDYTSSI
jgi:hypothetical protein